MARGLLISSGEDPIEERTLASLSDYQGAVGGWMQAIDLPDVGITRPKRGSRRCSSATPSSSVCLWLGPEPELGVLVDVKASVLLQLAEENRNPVV